MVSREERRSSARNGRVLGILRTNWTVLGLLLVLLLAGCAGLIDDGDTSTPESTPSGEAVVPDEGNTTGIEDAEVETLESFVESLEQADLKVVDYGFASDGFVGLVYRHDGSTVEADIEAVTRSYSEIAATEPWSPDELRAMTVDTDGDPVTTYQIETAAARSYANESITWDAYWTHIGRSYEVVRTDTPTRTTSDGGGFYYPDDADEETPTPTSGSAETPEPVATPTPTPTPDDDGWSIFPDDD